MRLAGNSNRVLDWGDSSDSDGADWGWNTPGNAEEGRGDHRHRNLIPPDFVGEINDSLVGCLASLVLVDNKNDAERRSTARKARQKGRTGRVGSLGRTTKTAELLRAGELQIEQTEREAKAWAREMESREREKKRKAEEAAEPKPFAERCRADSAALLESAECPRHFRAVDQLFPKLDPAKTCANQHNMVGEKLPEREVVFSGCGDVPVRHRKTGLLRFGGWDDDGRGERSDAATSPAVVEAADAADAADAAPEVLFDFTGNAGPEANADVYGERVEVTKEQERTAEDLKRQYLDILGKLNVDLGNGGAEKTETAETTVKKTEARDDDVHYPRDHPQALRIFAIQDFSKFQDESGKKKTTYRYRVCPLSTAWRELKDCEDQSKMHWYEIIREGFPCHLYFDLEYPKGPGLNDGLDDDALVDTLLALVRARLKADFDLDLRDDQVYELDSTTDRKFSRHLIVRIPGHAFYNVDHVGYFVQQVCADSRSSLLVRQNLETDRVGYIVDTGVYTKNRLFRLAYNCKCGGTGQTLQPTQRFASTTPQTPANVFASTLVTNMDGIDGRPTGQLKLLAVRRMLTMPQAVRDVRSGVEGAGCALDGVGHDGALDGVEEKPVRQEANQFMPHKEAMTRLAALAREAVPFVQTYATKRAGRPVSVKSWQILGGYGDVAYSLVGPGAHFCSNKGGDHNSNFVYIVANFYHARVAQKCFDQETCYKYKSPPSQMPEKFRWNPGRGA